MADPYPNAPMKAALVPADRKGVAQALAEGDFAGEGSRLSVHIVGLERPAWHEEDPT